MKNEDIVMTLLISLSASYKYLITTLETMLIKELTMDYVTTRLIHEVLKSKKIEIQGEDATMMLQQSNGNNSFPHQGAMTCFYCNKPSHIAWFCYKTNNKKYKNAKNAKNNNNYTFVT